MAATRIFSADLTDPASVALNKADIKVLEEKLTRAIAEHQAAVR
jgi:hypothetical protein